MDVIQHHYSHNPCLPCIEDYKMWNLGWSRLSYNQMVIVAISQFCILKISIFRHENHFQKQSQSRLVNVCNCVWTCIYISKCSMSAVFHIYVKHVTTLSTEQSLWLTWHKVSSSHAQLVIVNYLVMSWPTVQKTFGTSSRHLQKCSFREKVIVTKAKNN